MSEQTVEVNEVTQTLSKVARDYRIAMSEFSDAAKRREQFSLRAERRTNYWLRLSLGGLFLLVILLLLLMYVLMQHTQSLSSQIQTMNQHLTLTSQKLQALQSNPFTETFDSSPLSVQIPDHSPALKSIEFELQTLNASMAKVTGELRSIAKKATTQKTNTLMPVRYGYPYTYPYRQ